MSNMSYCRHENTADNLSDVIELWHEYDPMEANEFEKKGRKQLISLCKELLRCAGDSNEGEDDG